MIRSIITIVMIVAALVPLPAVWSTAATSIPEVLRLPPVDTLEAARVRVWIPVESSSRCRTAVQIKDTTGKVVRTLLDDLLARGYHNFYWDKRDDSGQQVPPGDYRFEARVCGKTRQGQLQAMYVPGEVESEIRLVDSISIARFEWQLKSDSALINAYIENSRGFFIDSVFSSHKVSRGQYTLEWSPPPGYAGRFNLFFQVDQYTHRVAFRLRSGSRRNTAD